MPVCVYVFKENCKENKNGNKITVRGKEEKVLFVSVAIVQTFSHENKIKFSLEMREDFFREEAENLFFFMLKKTSLIK